MSTYRYTYTEDSLSHDVCIYICIYTYKRAKTRSYLAFGLAAKMRRGKAEFVARCSLPNKLVGISLGRTAAICLFNGSFLFFFLVFLFFFSFFVWLPFFFIFFIRVFSCVPRGPRDPNLSRRLALTNSTPFISKLKTNTKTQKTYRRAL